MKKIVLLIASVAILVALLVLPSSASQVVGGSPFYVANQPVYVSLDYRGNNDFYSLDTHLPDVIPSDLYTYDDEYFILGNRGTADFSLFDQWFVAQLPSSWNFFSSAEVGVQPFVYRPTATLETLPDLEIDFEASTSVDYQLTYDVRVYSEDGRFIDQYVGGVSGTSAVAPPDAFPSLRDIIFQGFNSTYVFLINEYSLKLTASGRNFALDELAVKGNYQLTDTPSPSYEFLETPDVPAEVFFEDVGFGNIIWNSIVDIFNKPFFGDFSIGSVVLVGLSIPLLVFFLRLFLGG